ncbi:alpha/beta-hydrolase [Marasmius fiardii PR-910]|nr:alpha/beta-hydrolase [Marasmius fiardii PR-910]
MQRNSSNKEYAKFSEAQNSDDPRDQVSLFKSIVWPEGISKSARTGLTLLALFIASLLARNTLAADIVDTGYAKYLGNRTFPNVVAYLGIPYAEPPLSEQRFRAPLPLNSTRVLVESKGKVVDATGYPEFCVQGPINGTDHGGAGSEDCLKANIYAPAKTKKGQNLPVLDIAMEIQGTGLSTIGFVKVPTLSFSLSTTDLTLSVSSLLQSSPIQGGEDLNVGFLDQIQVLRWVKANIASFGGDPSKVTINGESAGGGSVQHHLVAHEGEQLFSGAIAQSVYRAPTPTPDQQQELFDFFVSQAGCDEGDITEIMSCLRKASVSDLALAQDAARSSAFGGAYNYFHPVVDGKVIVGNPTTLIREGKFAKVPVIVGATSNETVVAGNDPAVALKQSFPGLADDDVEDILAVAPLKDFTSAVQRFQVVTGESLLICAREVIGSAFSTAPKSWTYRFNQRNPTFGGEGVGHAAENWMMFLGSNTGVNGTVTFTPMTPVENAFAQELIAYWLSFVRAGDPNTFKLPRSPYWPEYTLNGPSENPKQQMVLQQDPNNSTTRSGSYIEQEPEKESERCGVVASKSEQQQN